MTDMNSILAALPRDARDTLDAWISQLRTELRMLPTSTTEEITDEVAAHVAETLLSDARPTSIVAALAEFGTPVEYATAIRDALDSGDQFRVPVTGRVLGMPYELRMPTAERVRSRWWDTSNSKIMVPKVFGLGWTINFGGLAVKLRLLHADDGEEPFESVPDRAMWVALAVPSILAATFIGVWALKHGGASAQVPTHWGPAGNADDWGSKGTILALSGAIVFAPYLWALWGYLSRDTKFSRIIICAFAASLETIGVLVYGLSIFEVNSVNPFVMVVGLLVPIFGIPFALLVGYARLGMSQELSRG